MAIEIDIRQIYEGQFGESGQPMPTSGVPSANGQAIRCPLTFAYAEVSYTFQFEPMISVRGRNIIARNHVLKNRTAGTVKEVWSADDYEIEIRGVVINQYDDNRLPEEEINILRNYCELRRAVAVDSPLLSLFGITQMAIEDYDFPHTKGYANQAFIIRGYSDKPFELF